jgi:hypothetical protein
MTSPRERPHVYRFPPNSNFPFSAGRPLPPSPSSQPRTASHAPRRCSHCHVVCGAAVRRRTGACCGRVRRPAGCVASMIAARQLAAPLSRQLRAWCPCRCGQASWPASTLPA